MIRRVGRERDNPARRFSRPPQTLAALLLAGCAGVGSTVDRLPDDASALGYVVVPRSVSLPQSRLTQECGPESLAAVLGFWGLPATVEQVSALIRDPQRPGTPGNMIVLAARQQGLRAALADGTVGRLKRAVDREAPPIIMVAYSGDFHYFVVSGYNDRRREIVCEEHGGGKRLISYDQLEEIWHRRFMIDLERSTADEDSRLGSAREQKGLYAEAAAFYRRALAADPDHPEARTGLGNCLLFTGKLEEALAEYRRALALNPDDPRVLNNIANVCLELKRGTAEAETLAGRAVELVDADFRRRKDEAARETHPALRLRGQKEAALIEIDLAGALGTLGQALAANGKHGLAIGAWKASYDHLPLTEFHSRARRLHEIGLAYRTLKMPAEARAHFERALQESRDPKQRAAIEADLK